MQTRHSYSLAVAITLCLVAIAVLFVMVDDPVIALDTTRYVATTGTDTGVCSIANTPCATVQYAVDQSDHGDTIKVAGGIYKGVLTRPVPVAYEGPPSSGIVTQVVYLTKTVHIEGGYAAPLYAWPPDPETNPTILDAEGKGRVILIFTYGSPTLQGLRITGGDAAGQGGDRFGNDTGGGINIGRATLGSTNTRVYSNTAERGGGVHVYDADLTLYQSDILSNTGTTDAGGLHAHFSDVKLDSNLVRNNTAQYGGGLSIAYSDGEILGNTIISNTGTFEGAGARLYNSDLELRANRFIGNDSREGGGLHFRDDGNAELVNNIVARNLASDRGSGIYVYDSHVRLRHTTIADNERGDGIALYLDGSTPWNSSAVLTNTIVAGHTVAVYATTGNTATLRATLGFNNTNNTGGTGLIIFLPPGIVQDPRFVDPACRDYHLAVGSPARDAGVDAGVIWDIDGQPRPMNAGCDLGADEVPWAAYLPLVMRRLP